MKKSDLNILIIEDDPQINQFLSFSVKAEGFQCESVYNGKEAVNIIKKNRCDLILLDLGLPDIDGMDIIKITRTMSEVPIIVVSARDRDKEKVEALDAGADDYLTKPFSASELMARIRVSLRYVERIEKAKSEINETAEVGDLKIDFEKRLVYLRGEEIHLTPLEYKLLSLMFRNIGKVLTTQYIISSIYGTDYGEDTRSLRTLMAGLRRKIEDSPAKPRYIITEIGVGYRLLDE